MDKGAAGQAPSAIKQQVPAMQAQEPTAFNQGPRQIEAIPGPWQLLPMNDLSVTETEVSPV